MDNIIASVAVWAGRLVVFAVCAGCAVVLCAYKHWIGATVWILALIVLIAESFPTVEGRVPLTAMWACAGLIAGGILWWMLVVTQLHG